MTNYDKQLDRVWVTGAACGVALYFAAPMIKNVRCRETLGLSVMAMSGISMGVLFPVWTCTMVVFALVVARD